MRHSGELRKRAATLASKPFASLLTVALLPEKVTLGNAPRVVTQAFESTVGPQPSGQGHLPTPSASTGWQ